MSCTADLRATLRSLPPARWDAYLAEHSGLPGPRANLELAAAAAEELPAQRLRRYASSPDEFLALCGATGLGRLAAEGDPDAVEELRALARDPTAGASPSRRVRRMASTDSSASPGWRMAMPCPMPPGSSGRTCARPGSDAPIRSGTAAWSGLWDLSLVIRDARARLPGMAAVYTHGHHESARDAGIATPERLERIAAGWRAWASAPDGWIALLHGEIICRV